MTQLPLPPDHLPYAAYGSPEGPHDAEHVRLLGIMHYVHGGLLLFFSLFALFYIGMGALMVAGTNVFPTPPTTSPSAAQLPAGFGWMFVGMGSCWLVWGGATGTMNLVAGRRLGQRRSRTFVQVVAAFNCLHMPLGTILAVFTFIVMGRDSVRRMFAASTPTD